MRPLGRGGLALLAAAAAAGCGHAQTQRPAVAAYVKQVNRIESSLSDPLAQVTRAGAAFASELHSGRVTEGPIVNSAEQTLQSALAKVRSAQARLVALPAPPPARHLRSLILALTAGELEMTGELTRLVAYLPRFDAALAGLNPAATALGHVLSRSSTGASAVAVVYAAKAAALRRFRASIEQALARLHNLQPPPVSSPGYVAELSSLRGMASSAGGLATALSTGALGRVDPLLTSFDRAATESRTRGVQRAQIVAVRAYDAESAKLTKLQAQIGEERLRLDNYLQ